MSSDSDTGYKLKDTQTLQVMNSGPASFFSDSALISVYSAGPIITNYYQVFVDVVVKNENSCVCSVFYYIYMSPCFFIPKEVILTFICWILYSKYIYK